MAGHGLCRSPNGSPCGDAAGQTRAHTEALDAMFVRSLNRTHLPSGDVRAASDQACCGDDHGGHFAQMDLNCMVLR